LPRISSGIGFSLSIRLRLLEMFPSLEPNYEGVENSFTTVCPVNSQRLPIFHNPFIATIRSQFP
jgi:hypothetical protein